jgi:hypothetical protein
MKLEDYFRADLSSIRVWSDSRAHRMNERAKSYALTIGDEIYFRAGFYDPDHRTTRFILAHEVAHVLQKRKFLEFGEHSPCASAIDSRQLEHEADCSAVAFARGDARCSLSPDCPPIPRAFGPVGHYYTVYYLAVAAGFTDTQASQLAYYAQLPDLITELDAKDVFLDWLPTYVTKLSAPGLGIPLLLAWLLQYGKGDTLDMMIMPVDFVAMIQRGLHCLTGADSDNETNYRTSRLLASNVNKPEFFGLAIHALGDSFAHRVRGREGTMYSVPFGHGEDLARKDALASIADRNQHFMDWGTWVDNINHRKELYERYGITLYGILKKKSGKNGVNDADVKNALNRFSESPDEKEQRNLIVKAISGLATPHFDALRDNTGSWLSYEGIDGKPKPSFENILYHAASWSRWRPILDQIVLRSSNINLNPIPGARASLSRKVRVALAQLESNIDTALRRQAW